MHPRLRRQVGAVAFLGLLLAVVLANWLIVHVGIVPVGFGRVAPAGVYAAAGALVCRDLVQNTIGKRWSVAAIATGAALSLLISPTFAIASAIAFAASETVDFAVYTALYRRSWLPAVLPAGLAGLIVDSALFLALAFGSEAFFLGQCVGKLEAVLAAIVLLAPLRRSYALTPA